MLSRDPVLWPKKCLGLDVYGPVLSFFVFRARRGKFDFEKYQLTNVKIYEHFTYFLLSLIQGVIHYSYCIVGLPLNVASRGRRFLLRFLCCLYH